MLTKEDLQAIAAIMDDKITASEQRMMNSIDEVRKDIAEVKEDLSLVKKDLTKVKKDTTVTRDAVNSLIEWTDRTSKIVDVPFMKEAK